MRASVVNDLQPLNDRFSLQILLKDADRLPILPTRGDFYYVSVTGLAWQIPFELMHSNCIAVTIPHEGFILGVDARYRLLVMRRSTDGPSRLEFEVDVAFTNAKLAQYVVAGIIGAGLLGLLLALAYVVRNTTRTRRLAVFIDFIKYELFLGK